MYVSLGQTFLSPLFTLAFVLYACVLRNKKMTHCLFLHSFSMYVSFSEKVLWSIVYLRTRSLCVCVSDKKSGSIVYLCIRSLCMRL